MVGTWVYDQANNLITGVGGTSATPMSFIDIYNADKAGTLTLLSSTATPFTTTLTTQIRVADSMAYQINLIVSGMTVAGLCSINGLDFTGNSINVTGTLSANGTFYTSSYFSSISNIICEGQYSLAVTQPRWGVISKPNSITYQLDAKLNIGDNTTSTYFTDTCKNIFFSKFFAYGAIILDVKANANFTLGSVLNLENKTTSNGCFIYVNNSGGERVYLMASSSLSVANFYGCVFEANRGGGSAWMANYLTRLWNCMFNNNITTRYLTGCDCYNVGFYNQILSHAFTNASQYGIQNTYDKIVINSCNYVIQTDGQNTPILKNLTVRNNTGGLWVYGNNPSGVKGYIIDSDCDSWVITFGNTLSATVYRQYSFNITTNPYATITLIDKNNNTIFTEAADVNGAISEHTVSMGYYETATGSTLQLYGPHTLIISKEGYQPYNGTISIDKKTQLSITLSSLSPYPIINGNHIIRCEV